MSAVIRVLGREDADLLGSVAEGVFDGPVNDAWAREFIADPRHHLAVAIDGGQIVGMASAVHYVHPDKGPELWINEVGVADSHQRQGLAKKMLEAILAHGRTLGCEQAWVLTDRSNDAANGLYRSAGGVVTGDTVMYEFGIE